MSEPDSDAVERYLLALQQNICQELESLEPEARFEQEAWQREAGGGGISRVISEGDVFEKGGVNFSHVFGDALPASATANRPELAGRSFQAMGVSAVFHPRNPYVPSSHVNVRFFIANTPGEKAVWWFGGGYDLTPYYPFEEDCLSWHRAASEACQTFGPGWYPYLKKACDDYFYLPHRQEARGIGGLFFDDFNEWDFKRSFDFTKSIGDSYLGAYKPIISKRKDTAYEDRQRQFQLYRRGRYVEFNLVYDRGTLFGLQSQGRTESILMSLPPLVRWDYNWQPDADSEEARVYEFLEPRDWIECR